MSKPFTWEQVVQSKPKTFSHPMFDSGMRDHEGRWVEVFPITQLSMEFWQTGPEASQIVPGSVWLGERVIGLGNVIILNIWNDKVWRVDGVVKELFQTYPSLINGGQHGFLSMMYGSVPPVVYRNVLGREKKMIYMISLGPTIKELVCMVGKSSTQFASVSDVEVEYIFCREPLRPRVNVEVSDYIRLSWQRLSYSVPQTINYLDINYYYEGSDEYAGWSFQKHADQVHSIVKDIPVDRVLIGPGDGYGVLATTGRKCVVGDLRPRIDSPPETFLQTMKRGDRNGVLILSYVVSLMSTEDKDFVHCWEGPLVVIDSHCPAELLELKRVAPGIFVRNFPWVKYNGLKIVEGYTESVIQFSENLLRLETISDLTNNNATRYWTEMRPFAKRENKGPIVVETLSELFTVMKRYPSRMPWLSPIGSYMTEVQIPRIEPECLLTTRTVYRIPITSSYVTFIKAHSHWGVDKEALFFCFSGKKQFEMKVGEDRVFVRIVEMTVATGIKLLHVTTRSIIWLHVGKIIVWSRTIFTVAIAWIYLNEYGVGAWKRRLTGVNNYDPKSGLTHREKVLYDTIMQQSLMRKNVTPIGWCDIPSQRLWADFEYVGWAFMTGEYTTPLFQDFSQRVDPSKDVSEAALNSIILEEKMLVETFHDIKNPFSLPIQDVAEKLQDKMSRTVVIGGPRQPGTAPTVSDMEILKQDVASVFQSSPFPETNSYPWVSETQVQTVPITVRAFQEYGVLPVDYGPIPYVNYFEKDGMEDEDQETENDSGSGDEG